MAHIIAVDDDADLRALLKTALERDGHQVTVLSSGGEIGEKHCRWADCILLDVMMPGEDGFAACRRIREMADCPILFLTAKTGEADVITGLGLGGDDYLTKPFSVEELLARVRVALRRLAYDEPAPAAEVYRNGGLAIDFDSHVVTRDGAEVHLTPIEYKLLALLARNTGKVLTHNYILKEVWGQALASDLPSLRVFMATLRKKIEPDPATPCYLQTHVGVGYRMLRVE